MKMTVQATLWLAAAVLLSACGDDDRQDARVEGSLEQLARIVAQKQDRVAVDDLARWIIEGRKDFVLIDIRSADDFAAGHIDSAEHIPLTELVSSQHEPALPKDRKLVLYSQGSELAAQAVVLLRLSGYDANLLLGGYNFWSQHVLNPDIHPTRADGEYPRVPEQQAIACYFVGGNAVAQAPAPAPGLPAFVPPVSRPVVAPPPSADDEGC